MHELSLAGSVLRIIEDVARRERFNRVKSLRLQIGRLSAIEPEALRFSFEVVVRGSVAEGARLDIVETTGMEMRVLDMDVE